MRCWLESNKNKTVASIYLGCAAVLLCASTAQGQTRLTLQQAGSRVAPDFVPAYEGKEVLVSGQVSSPAILITDSYYLPIQDEAQYGLLVQGSEARFRGLAPGDWVEAQGTIIRRGGRPVLVPRELLRRSHGDPPAPRRSRPDELVSFRYLGVLVTTEAMVSDLDQNTGGDLLIIGPKTRGLSVFLPRARRDSGPQLSGFREGDRVRVTGISSQYCTLPPYDQYFQILIANPAAVAILERGWLIEPPVLLGSLIAAAALLAIWWFRESRMSALRRQMRLLNALGEEVIRATSPAEILRRLTLSLATLGNASGVGLYIQNRGTKLLESVHSTAAVLETIDLEAPKGAIASAVATCFRNRMPLAIPDTRRSPFFRREDGVMGPRSMLLVPMLAQGELVGVLELRHSDHFHYFNQAEQAAMQHLANQIATALTLQEQHSIREQLFRSEKLAAAGQLISGVADELRSPLHSIVELASTIEDRRGQAREPELDAIRNEARRASEIVARLVSFGKVEQGEVGRVDLNGLLSGLLKFRAPEWKVKGVETQTQLVPKRAIVLGSAGQLEQVLLNLLVDAEKSAAEASDKTILVTTSLLAKRVLVEISFPTRSSDVHRTDVVDGDPAGSGALGLSVCRGIIQSHGGEFRVLRVSPTQARFDVELPVVEFGSGTSAGGELGDSSRQLTVLVVEPDSRVQRQLVQLLGTRGDRVVPVSSAEEGADMVERLRFDMVLCAVRLPGLNWMEFFERVQRQVGGLVLLTERFNEDVLRSFRGGEAFALSKPIDEAELHRICRNIEERAAVNN
ncbi:MAG TPA: hybrid sensor histidine kinase/response regulator [Bryobacteraceae bacterium]|nr:hybrid sensor histidine kinase/response regulator [Bryobacteraceae bacterium]